MGVNNMTFGARLKQVRKDMGFEAQYVAKKLNVAKSTYSGYENDKTKPSFEILQSIAELFNVSTDYLLGIEKNLLAQPQTTTSTEITDKLEQLKQELAAEDSLMFDGKPATAEQIEAIVNALDMGKAYATQKAKEKFTRNDYRK